MAKFKLNTYDNIYDTLLFWLKRYLKFKLMTLSNEKADEKTLQKAFIDIEKAKSFDEVDTIARMLKKQVPIYTYYYPISKFIQWLSKGVIDDIKDIDLETTLEWLTQVTSSKSGATKINYKNALINFFEFLSKNNEEKYNFDIDLKAWQKNLANLATKKPDYLSEEQLERFLNILENHKFIKGGSKDKAKEDFFLKALYTLAIKFALFGGLRISEIANLTLDDLYINKDLDVLEIYVRKSKNNKYRIVTIPYSNGKYAIKKDLDFYLQERAEAINECDNINKKQLFFSSFCNKLSSPTLENILSGLLREAGLITEKKGMHLLRHTHASFFYKKTQDPVLLKERLGHSDIRTTMKYTHLDEEKIKKSADVMR